MSILLLILGIVLFVGLVIVHEFGHFIVARRNNVAVEEFAIFFPPRLYKRKTKAGWLFTFNLLPLGGFVKLKGEHDSDTEPGTYGAASLGVKTRIMVAGVVMNFITALVLFTVLALVGLPKLVDNQFTVKQDAHLVENKILLTYVDPSSPAAKAGLKPFDEIEALALPDHSPVDITGVDQSRQVTKDFAGKTVDIYYARNGRQLIGHTTLLNTKEVAASQKTDNPKGFLGIVTQQYMIQRYTWSAPVVAVGFSAQIIALTFQGLWHVIIGVGSILAGVFTGNTHARQNGQSQASQLVGPVGIYYVLQASAKLGILYVILVIAYISLILALTNILPIPALDGGRLWLTLASRGLKHRPLQARTEEAINAVGFLLLIGLLILITVVDLHRFG